MTIHAKALMWAAIIIGAALLAKSQGLSDSASFGVIAGLCGASIGSLYGGRSKACSR